MIPGMIPGMMLSTLDAALTAPFGFGFMRRALAGCLALSVAGPPLGVLLVLRRMSLMSDVLEHGILPGIALGALAGGLSFWAMGLGGLLAGLAVALLAGSLARATGGHEDSQLAGCYLVALALGVAIVSGTRGIDLTQLLFGSALGVDDQALLMMAGVATVTLLGLAVIWRPLIADSVDPGFLRAVGGHGPRWHLAFLALVVLAVVGGFTVLGTLMSVGLMMLPAIAARHWSARLPGQMRAAVVLAVLASVAGLLLSYHADLPTGPAIILTAGALWLASLALGPRQSLVLRWRVAAGWSRRTGRR
jgi:zinc/manganese transport system permease protein